MIGQTVSHFRILEQLGAGGMGVVYLAEDLRLGRRVALKFLPPQALPGDEELARFRREARTAASLSHPNVCTIFEIDEHDGRPFIAMELVEGRTLAALIAEGPLPLARALDIAVQVADGLIAAHARGIVHRDLKPANVMVTGAGLAKIMDFGLACAGEGTRLTREGSTLGTVAYMAPEQARGEAVDRRADLWALGALIYEMLTGRRPFRGEHDPAVVYAILHEEPEPPTALRTGVPLELERIVLKALCKRPEDRYQHADDLRADLRRLARETAEPSTALRGAAATTDPGGGAAATPPAAAGPATPDPATPSPATPAAPGGGPRRHRARWLLGALGAVAALLAVYLLLGPFGAEELDAAPRPIAVIGFENLSGDPQFDYLCRAIPNLLITSLEQSPYLRVTTWERLRDLARQTGRPDSVTIDKELGYELCRLDGVDAIVVGSFVKAGGTFVTEAKVLDVRSKELLRSASARGDGPESILRSQVDELSRAIAEGVGLSAQRTARQRPVSEMTTSSLEAYEHYVRGRDAYEALNDAEAKDELERAVRIDSTFAVAQMLLALTYQRLHQIDLRDRHGRMASRYAAQATERERLHIEAFRAALIDGDTDETRRIVSELLRKYPKDKRAAYLLGLRLKASGSSAESIAMLQRALALDPDFAPVHNQLAYALMDLGDYEGALEHLRRYARLCPGEANPHDSMGDLHLRLQDVRAAMAEYRQAVAVRPDFTGSMNKLAYFHGVAGEYDSALAWAGRFLAAAPTGGMEAEGLTWRMILYASLGRYEAALADAERAQRLLASAGSGLVAPLDFAKASICLDAGRPDEARMLIGRFDAARQTYPDKDATFWGVNSSMVLALTALLDDETERAEDLLRAMREGLAEYPPDGSEARRAFMRRRVTLTAAELALAAGRPEEAVRLMRSDFSPDPATTATWQLQMSNVPGDQDALPRALAAEGDLEGAVAEYRQLLAFDTTGRDRRLLRPVYLHRLAGVLERAGRPAEAAAAEERFLGYWSAADPDRPELGEARARLQRLRAAAGPAGG